MRVLLHICCGPCALYPLKTLHSFGHEVTCFFYNHNIHPYQEYVKRRDTAEQMAKLESTPLIMHDQYNLEIFLANVASNQEKRCNYCYTSRMQETAETAIKEGFEAYTTSLLYSKYQKHEEIRAIGEKFAKEYGIKFLYEDFRVGWQEGIKLSKELELYRQTYCGCIYSEKERYMNSFSKKSTNKKPA